MFQIVALTSAFSLFHSLHGLVRGDNMELGRDSDTGGQVLLNLTQIPLI